MNLSIVFARIFYFLLCIVVMTLHFTIGHAKEPFHVFQVLLGLSAGVGIGLFLLAIDLILQRFRLREMTVTITGLLIGSALAYVVWLILGTVLDEFLTDSSRALLRTCVTLFGTYLGVIFTLRSADEWYLSFPFIRLKLQTSKKRDILVDLSALMDPRLIDLASIGLVDRHLVIPRFMLSELYERMEDPEDAQRSKVRRAIDTVKKLEALPDLELRYDETSPNKSDDGNDRMVTLARMLNANILTADMNRIQMASVEGVRVINMHSLSNSMKPIMQSGENLEIKIQRYGKESRQGVGYLDDGTMVVVNGGGDYIGETIKAQVLSVKHTSSGRMIFCNAFEEMEESQQQGHFALPEHEMQSTTRH